MKVLGVLLAVVALVAGKDFQQQLEAQDRSISSLVVEQIEAARDRMPCGFPGMGIPILAPLRASHRELQMGREGFDLDAKIDDFRMDGLDKFNVTEFKIKTLRRVVEFKFSWEKVHLKTLYDMNMELKSGIKLRRFRKGTAKIAVHDIVVSGTAKYAMGLTGGGVSLKEFRTSASIGAVKSEIDNLSKYDPVNQMINEIIEEWLLISINDHEQEMGDLFDKLVTPIVNNLIGGRTIGEIIGGIGGGGGGGEGVEKPPKEPCVPPEDYYNH